MNTPYNLELFAFFSELQNKSIPEDFNDQVFDRFDIDLSSVFGKTHLKNPLLIDCNKFGSTMADLDQISKSGFGGIILQDIDCKNPQLNHLENLSEYINIPVFGSIKINFQEFDRENLRNTVSKYVRTDIKSLIISPLLEINEYGLYKESVEIVREIADQTFFRINNAEMDYSSRLVLLEHLYAAEVDGVVIKDINLNDENIKNGLIEWIKSALDVPVKISIAGSVSNGSDIYDFLKAGAENVQITDFDLLEDDLIKYGSRFGNAFFKLILDPEDGIISSMLREGKF